MCNYSIRCRLCQKSLDRSVPAESSIYAAPYANSFARTLFGYVRPTGDQLLHANNVVLRRIQSQGLLVGQQPLGLEWPISGGLLVANYCAVSSGIVRFELQ